MFNVRGLAFYRPEGLTAQAFHLQDWIESSFSSFKTTDNLPIFLLISNRGTFILKEIKGKGRESNTGQGEWVTHHTHPTLY